MAKRLNKTLLDYLVIAISPAMIILLVDSLVLFLIQVFYRGNFHGKLEYVFTMFVIGAVLIGRISIEEGRERAMLFAAPLGIAILLATSKFVTFQGPLASVSFFINCGLIALIWWSADKLVWDCTLIDEKEEDSGEGLLETIGLDRPDHAAVQREIAPVAPEQVEATTSRDHVPTSWWDRFVERRRRPHAPGVWVVYFSLAALPLFGIGQLLIPSGDSSARQYAFQLLFVYTASGLGLLLSTSFLGLRRYLRQRRQEMPLLMVNLWLGIGLVLIFAVMFVALLLPRPNAEYAISEPPIRVGSPDQNASPLGMGREGVEEKQPDARLEPRDDAKDDAPQSDQPGKKPSADGDKASEKGEKSSKDKDGDKSSEGGEKSSKDKNGEKSSEGGEKSSKDKDGEKSSKDGPKPEESGKNKTDKKQEKSKDSARKPGETGKKRSDKEPDKSADERKNEKQPEEKRKSGGTSGMAQAKPPQETKPKPQEGQKSGGSPRTPAMPHWSFSIGASLAAILKWIFYLALAVLLVYAAWKNRVALLAALRDFRQALADLWNRLFGSKARQANAIAEEEKSKKPSWRRFADFTDPFATGVAGRSSPKELVQYTFEALEAWARDNGHPRLPEQTPHEFARSVGSSVSSLADDTRHLAELYCQVAYASGSLSAASVTRLSHLWQEMRAAVGRRVSPAADGASF